MSSHLPFLQLRPRAARYRPAAPWASQVPSPERTPPPSMLVENAKVPQDITPEQLIRGPSIPKAGCEWESPGGPFKQQVRGPLQCGCQSHLQPGTGPGLHLLGHLHPGQVSSGTWACRMGKTVLAAPSFPWGTRSRSREDEPGRKSRAASEPLASVICK